MHASKQNFIVISENLILLAHALVAIHAFTDANCVAVCSRDSRLFRLTNLARREIHADLHGSDDQYLVAELSRLTETMPDAIIVPCDCPGERLVDRIRGHLHAAIIPVPNAAMLNFNDKWWFYQFCRQHDLPVPPSRWIASKRDLHFDSVAHGLGLPFVVKPLSQEGSNGVCVIASEEEYRNNILHNAGYAFAPLIAQRYIEGTDVGVNLLAIHGRVTAIAVQQRDFPQHFSSPIEFISSPDLERAAHSLCEISGYHGMMNIDARVEDGTGKVFLLESNPRLWGSLLASVWCGLNFIQACIDPPLPAGQIRQLHAGRADTHRHPIVRPALWGQALFSPYLHRRRMLRRMLCDLWTFQHQVRVRLKNTQKTLGSRVPFS